MSLSERDLSFLFDFLGNCFGNAGGWWRGLFSERGTGIIKEARVLLLSLVSPPCPKGGNVLLLLVVGQHSSAPGKGCFLRTPTALLLQSTGKAEGSGLDCPAAQVCSFVHTDLQQSYEESEQHCGSGGLPSQWSSVKTMAFCHRLTLAAQIKDGVWD